MEIKYIHGDATDPVGNGMKVICHVCNDAGAWGAGFVLAVSKRWPDPERRYRQMPLRRLGMVDFVPVQDGIIVANMIAQRGLPSRQRPIALSYDALERCLEYVSNAAMFDSVSLHMPRIGCGIAGGSWVKVSEIIKRTCCDRGVAVYVYDLV